MPLSSTDAERPAAGGAISLAEQQGRSRGRSSAALLERCWPTPFSCPIWRRRCAFSPRAWARAFVTLGGELLTARRHPASAAPTGEAVNSVLERKNQIHALEAEAVQTGSKSTAITQRRQELRRARWKPPRRGSTKRARKSKTRPARLHAAQPTGHDRARDAGRRAQAAESRRRARQQRGAA